MSRFLEALVTWTLRVLAPLGVAYAVAGGVRNYSPVPFWDMWPSTVEFVLRIAEGRWSEWWTLHNEHRIVLARVLFWIDNAWFGGVAVFLIAVNYLLVFGAFLTLRAALRARAGPAAAPGQLQLLVLFMLLCLFSWMQKENLTWGFQSQFFLAQWLPLLALYLLYRATLPMPQAPRDFVLACTVGVLCIGTMASGVIALPLMVAYAVLLRMGWKRVAVLAVLTALCLGAYFIDYRSTPGHGSLADVLRYRPVKLLQYILLYLGSPFYYLFGQRSLPVGQLFGLVFVVLAVAQAVRSLRAPRQHALPLALLAFILYIGGTALGTGAGRLLFGLHQATASRYTTPALMAWMALLVLYAPLLLRELGQWRQRIVWPLLALVLGLAALQAKAGRSQVSLLFERSVAAVALELGIRDHDQLLQVVFSPELGVLVAERASAADIGVFHQPWLRGLRETMDQAAGALPQATCAGALVELESLPDERGWQRVTGWIAPPGGTDAMRSLRLVGADGRVAGHALAGARMKDPLPARAGLAGTRAFKGYVRARAAHQPLLVVSAEAACVLRLPAVPAPPFAFVPYQSALATVNVAAAQITGNAGWTGSDFQRSSSPGYRTLGSFVRGDVDTGAITLQLQRGDGLFYRSGPQTRRQRYRVDDGGRFAGSMPRAERWVAIVFDNPALPDTFTLVLSDEGDGWGEWSAISVRDRAATEKKP